MILLLFLKTDGSPSLKLTPVESNCEWPAAPNRRRHASIAAPGSGRGSASSSTSHETRTPCSIRSR